MTTAVVIPAYNGLVYLQANLPAVLDLKADEVIVVDDASTDKTSEFIRNSYPDIHLITNVSNRRFPKSVNIGFSSTSADVIFLLNQDTRPDMGLIKSVIPYFKKNPKMFAVTFNEGRLGWAKVEFVRGWLQYTSQISKSPHASFWASGGSAAFSKTLWDKLGGFDPVFSPGYHEDLDIGWRARKHGLEILWLPRAKVEHEREATFSKTFSVTELQHIKERNYLICHWKNLGRKYLWLHVLGLTRRCLLHPGFINPLFMAIQSLPAILRYRHSAKNLLSDTEVFHG